MQDVDAVVDRRESLRLTYKSRLTNLCRRSEYGSTGGGGPLDAFICLGDAQTERLLMLALDAPEENVTRAAIRLTWLVRFAQVTVRDRGSSMQAAALASLRRAIPEDVAERVLQAALAHPQAAIRAAADRSYKM